MTNTNVPQKYRGILIMTHGENNGYHDSYWYVTIWNVQKGEPQRVLVGTTAAGGDDMWFPEGGIVDLTEENQIAHEAYKQQKHEAFRKEQEEYAATMNITLDQYDRLRNSLGVTTAHLIDSAGRSPALSQLHAIEELLKTTKFKSKFRESIATQVRTWLGEESPKYKTPLSDRQLHVITRYWN